MPSNFQVALLLAALAAPWIAFAQPEHPESVDKAVPRWRALIQTTHFKTWLESESKAARALATSRDARDMLLLLDKYQRHRLVSKAKGVFELTCKYRSGQVDSEDVYWVDNITSLVAFFPANISSSRIEFIVPTKPPQSVVIDRRTGAYKSFSAEVGVISEGTCKVQ